MNKRILPLNHKKSVGSCVVYVMSRDQRVQDNHALLAAQHKALELKVPLVVLFCLYSKSGFRAREHFVFMVKGLKQLESELAKLKIPLIMLIGNPKEEINNFISTNNVASVYFDFSPLNGPRKLQKDIAHSTSCSAYVVDTHNIIPVWVTSDKQEYAARTIRTKIHKKLPDWLDEPGIVKKHPHLYANTYKSIKQLDSQIAKLLANITSNNQSILTIPGEVAAHKQLQTFITTKLATYWLEKNNPTLGALSNLSPYLHFGHISPQRIALEVNKAMAANPSLKEGAQVFLEELIVRKELSDNYCFYNKNYTNLSGAADWAIKTLNEHKNDPREFTYTYKQLERGNTHDEIWNAAEHQLVTTGKMHGYMRMYWAKKVLEWTESPETAITYLIQLNDFYHLDGGDPNGYVGILWSVAGLHDRPWFNRSVYGTVRYMNDNGLKRKFDTKEYIKQNS